MKKEIIKVQDKKHLRELIKKEIEENGLECNLNHLDISNVDDLSNIFEHTKFQGNISEWNTSNVKNMYSMFFQSKFNGNISKWDISSVEDIDSMFENSKFERFNDLNSWKPYSLEYNNIYSNEMKNKEVYWSNEYINLKNNDIKDYINKYFAKKEKEELINQNSNNINLISKKKNLKFKI